MGRVPRGPARLAGVAPEEGAGHRPGGGPGGVAQEDQGVVGLVVETEPAGRQLVPPAQWVFSAGGGCGARTWAASGSLSQWPPGLVAAWVARTAGVFIFFSNSFVPGIH